MVSNWYRRAHILEKYSGIYGAVRQYYSCGLLVTGACLASVSSLQAADVVIPSGTTETNLQFLPPTVSLLVEEGAAIDLTGTPGSPAVVANFDTTIVNRGTIASAATFTSTISGTDNHIVTNHGTISVEQGTFNSAMGFENNNFIYNYGDILSTSFQGNGLNVLNDNIVENAGLISTSNEQSLGIQANDGNTITNSGRIQTAGGLSLGIGVRDNNTIINSGEIHTTQPTTAAIYGEANNTVINSGWISATGGGGAAAVFFESGTNVLTLRPGSRIVGRIELGSGTDTVNIESDRSTVLTFSSAPEEFNASGMPSVQNGLSVATLDASAFALRGQVVGDLADGIAGAVSARLSGLRSGLGNTYGYYTKGDAVPHPAPLPGPAPEANIGWVQLIGTYRKNEASGAIKQSKSGYGGLVAGFDGEIRDALRVGGLIGGSLGQLDIDDGDQKIDGNSFFAGLYASYQQEQFFADMVLLGGRTNYDSTRTVYDNQSVNGVSQAGADYAGNFISPSLSAGTIVQLSQRQVELSGRVTYAKMWLDGYAESGSNDNLVVPDSTVSSIQGRLQASMPISSGPYLLAPRLGIEGRKSSSGDLTVSMLGQSVTFDPGGDDREVTGFTGFSASRDFSDTMNVFVDGETHFSGDGFSHLNARGGVKAVF